MADTAFSIFFTVALPRVCLLRALILDLVWTNFLIPATLQCLYCMLQSDYPESSHARALEQIRH